MRLLHPVCCGLVTALQQHLLWMQLVILLLLRLLLL
jgi:hypothetical protein